MRKWSGCRHLQYFV